MLMVLVLAFSSAVSANEFTDTDKHWAKYSIDYVTSEGYFCGTSTTEFSPDMSMTRGMFVTVLSRMSGIDASVYSKQVFTDVKENEYYFSAVNWAYENKIVAGTGNGMFRPADLVTREQMSLMLGNFLDYMGKTPEVKNEIKKYADNAKISSWAYDAVYLMQGYGYLVGGSNNQFRPADNATRAECAAVFSRLDGHFFGAYVEKEELPEDSEELTGMTLVGDFESTFYCPDYCCNGKWAGTTSSGVIPVPGITVAVDSSVIPLGTKLYVEFEDPKHQHLNGIYIAQDTGGAIYGFKIDVMVGTHAICESLGRGAAKVYIINE